VICRKHRCAPQIRCRWSNLLLSTTWPLQIPDSAEFTPDEPLCPRHVDPLICASIDSTTCRPCLLSLVGTTSYNFDCKPQFRLENRREKSCGRLFGNASCKVAAMVPSATAPMLLRQGVGDCWGCGRSLRGGAGGGDGTSSGLVSGQPVVGRVGVPDSCGDCEQQPAGSPLCTRTVTRVACRLLAPRHQ